MKRFLIIIVILLLIGAAVVGGLLFYTGRVGSSAVEQWVGRQLSAIANDALRPQFAFESLDYRFPATATLNGVTLRDGETTIFEAASATVVLTERPRIGEPIVIESIELTEPTVRLIQTEDGSLVGFSNLVDSVEGEVKPDGGSTKPSDVFAIRTIRILSGIIIYNTPNGEPMRLDDITLDLTTTPSEAGEKGWYALDATLLREPVFSLALDSRVNIDTMEVTFGETKLEMQLREDQYGQLPPQLQTLVRRHEVRGALAVTLSGQTILTDPIGGDLDLNMTLTDGLISFDEYVVPVDSLDLTADLRERMFTVDPLMVSALGGTTKVRAEANLSGEKQAQARIDVNGVRVEEALRPAGNEPPRYKGRIALELDASASLAEPVESLAGIGSVAVDQGRFIELPILGGLIRLVNKAAKTGDDSRLNADLELEQREVRVKNLELVTSTVAARGEGEIFLDGTVNFRINAGPLERVQQSLGPIGDIFGKLTDKLVTYQVTGTSSDPKFAVKPLGIGAKSGKKEKTEPKKKAASAENDANVKGSD